MKKIGIVGYGYVGKAMTEMIKSHYNVLVYDPKYSKKDNFNNVSFIKDFSEFKDCDLGIICVPTPSKEDGSCDTSLVEDAVKKIQTEVVLIKSTVSPGTTDKLKKETEKRIVFSPEYVGESKYYNPYFNDDMKAVPFVIFGGDDEDSNYIIDLFLPILGPTKTYYKTSSLNAEIIKYMENTYFATKITFMNEMYNICKSMGADWHSVREGWLLDPRVERMHTAVFKDKPGFSGKCLPKDTEALVESAKKHGYKPEFLEEMIKSNKKFKEEI